MLTGDIRYQVDQLWNAFWSGGITNSITVIEKITYPLFLKRLKGEQTAAERQARISNSLLPGASSGRCRRARHSLRASPLVVLTTQEPRAQFTLVDQHVLPFLETVGGDGTT